MEWEEEEDIQEWEEEDIQEWEEEDIHEKGGWVRRKGTTEPRLMERDVFPIPPSGNP